MVWIKGYPPSGVPARLPSPQLKPLMPLLAIQRDGSLKLCDPWAPGKYDYYCPGPCAGVCRHRKLSVAEAYRAEREAYARGDDEALERMLAYVT